MSKKAPAKKFRVVKKNGKFLPYNMGHILYMAQLAGKIEKSNLVSSMPKHERERYESAFEFLVNEGFLKQAEVQGKKQFFSINPDQTKSAKELIHRFVRGIKEEAKEEQIKKNPFFHRGPIKDTEYFVGRQEVVSHVYDRLRHTEDCSIIGPRAIGKTSLLHYISNDSVVRKYKLDPKKYIFIYYDLERFGKNAEVKDFYYEMFSRTVSQIISGGQILEQEIKKINGETGNVIRKINKPLFEFADLENLITALSERDYSIVYLFDEFESVAHNLTFDFSFYGQLRALSGNPAFKVAFVTASKKSIYDLTFIEEIKTSPFFRYFEDFELGSMTKGELEGFFELASENGVVLPDNVRALVDEWSGRHPFLVQLACNYFFDLAMKGEKIESAEEEQHLINFIKRHKKHFAYFWKQVSKKEQECLWKVASEESLGKICKGKLENLEESYLIVKENGEYRLFSKAFERFVKDNPPVKAK
jgi:hypothetical protein